MRKSCDVSVKISVVILLLAGSALAQQPAREPVPALLQNYEPVTSERLKKPEDGDWLMIRRTYDGWGFSPLRDITTSNAHRLQPVWIVSTGQNGAHEAPADRQQRGHVRGDTQPGPRH